jgi:hypothetical protein
MGGAVVTAKEVLKAARTAGIHIHPEGDQLVLRANATPAPAMIELITRHKANVMAFLQASIVEWLDQHPEPSNPGHCAWCQKRETADAFLVPFGVQPGTHIWLHPECWRDWHLARRKRAAAALASGATP